MPAPATAPRLRVALPVPLPHGFDYLPPAGREADAGWIGCRVRVRLGARELVGIVEAVVDDGSAPPSGIRAIVERLDPQPVLGGELLQSLRWVSHYYKAPLGETLATALPADLRQGRELPSTRQRAWALTEQGHASAPTLRGGARPWQLAQRLASGPVSEAVLDAEGVDWRAAMRGLARRGLVEAVQLSGVETPASAASPRLELTDEQQAAVDALLALAGRFQPVVLEGVTGSGKTEVYLEAIRACLAQGRQALVLVPEIGLAPQTLRRFEASLGVAVHTLHSGLSDGERARNWVAAARGEARLVVGTRSAVFTPLPDAGLIVVDEEHDTSYKQQDGVRYGARDVAIMRARALGVPVVLGSATPSLESLAQVRRGAYAHLRLTRRATGAPSPRVRLVDVRKRRLDAGLGQDALEAIAARIEAGQQVLVFRNRRGYAPVLQCHDCGWHADCHQCDARMTVHARGHQLICHHCGARRRVPPACPDCGSLGLQPQGAGTERIEEALAERFPDTTILRVDRASTRQRDGLARQLARLGDAPGILVGTQMLAKGHDLPGLGLVCVVGVDEGLFSADFRASERLAQLLVQVSGRAGRARIPGEVLLQTHQPDHPLLATLLSGGYPAFCEQALEERELAGFPPFAHLAMLRAEARHEGPLAGFMRAARDQLDTVLAAPSAVPVSCMGPLPAPMARRAGHARAQILLSCPVRPALHAVLDRLLPAIPALPDVQRVRWSIDVDPADLF